jgi:hypothetical protein
MRLQAIVVVLMMVIGCRSPELEPTPTIVAVIDPESVGLLGTPEPVEVVQELSATQYDLLCLGQERKFPEALDSHRRVLETEQTIEEWATFLGGTTVVDMNTRGKAFEVRDDGTGVWIDSALRPRLHGHSFSWTITISGQERWSDVNLEMRFDDSGYKLVLPLYRRDRQIVEPTGGEGLFVTETRDCGEFSPPEDLVPIPEYLWKRSPGLRTAQPPEVIPVELQPKELVLVEDQLVAGTSYQWGVLNSQLSIENGYVPHSARPTDYIAGGGYLWIAASGGVRKLTPDGELVTTIQIAAPGDMAFDGENLWVARTDSPEILKYDASGTELLRIELKAKARALEIIDGQLWFGVPDLWTVDSYDLGGDQLSSTYVKGRVTHQASRGNVPRAGSIRSDGQHIWVTLPAEDRLVKLNSSGSVVGYVELPGNFTPTRLIFDGTSMWVIKLCCASPDVNNTQILRLDMTGNWTGQFNLAYPARDVVLFDDHLWFSHELQTAFTKLKIDAEDNLWVEAIGPYSEDEIFIDSEFGKIAGTLTIPQGNGPFPIVILPPRGLDHGRDIFSKGIYRITTITDSLARNGLAAFRYDPPGIGKSGGDALHTTFPDMAENLHAVINTLKNHQSLDANRIGTWAIGSSGIYTSKVAAERDDLAFTAFSVLVVGNVLKTEISPQILNLRFTVESEDEIGDFVDLYNEALVVAETGSGWSELEEKIRLLQSEDDLGIDIFTSQPFLSLRTIQSERWQSLLTFSTTEYIEQIQSPTMIMYHGLDFVAHPSFFVPLAEEAIERSGNMDSQVVVIEKANDFAESAKSGHFSEVRSTPPQWYPSYIKPGYIETFTNWILERMNSNAQN